MSEQHYTEPSSDEPALGPRVGELSKQLQEGASVLQDRLQEVDEEVRTFVKEHPFVAVGAAAATGYLLGRLLSRYW